MKGGGGRSLWEDRLLAVHCVCTSPQPSLNREGRSEKRLRSTTSVFLLCVRETPDGCLSCSHAKAGPGTMVTAGPHTQKAEVSQRAEEVIGFLMAIAVVSWERPWLGPCAVLTVSRRGNVASRVMTPMTRHCLWHWCEREFIQELEWR